MPSAHRSGLGLLGALSLLAWLLLASVRAELVTNETNPVSIFRSRPDLVAPVLVTFQQQRDLQAPGYYFVAPYQQEQETVYIYDNDANLVWSGFGAAGPGVAHAPQVCRYHGEPHLCFYQGKQMMGWAHGHGIIMDQHYRVVKSVEPGNYQASSDMHEFRLSENGETALMTQYLRSAHNLCDFGICNGLGYIQQGAFQEIDVESGKVLFEWRSLDHVHPSESYVMPNSTEISGTGEEPASPWDYFHINSVDKNADGDYLISARHTSCIYKISGDDGHVIWRLNGANSDFQIAGETFSFQHDARFVSESDEETILSIFDNGSNGFNQTQEWSTAILVSIDHRTQQANVIRQYDPPDSPDGRHLSRSQGSFQQLKNGNVLLGWGSDAMWTEYTEEGEVVFDGTLGFEGVMNYRVYKFDGWVGRPLTVPALWTYSKNGTQEAGTWFYASWNGATEVLQWAFYMSDHPDGPWEHMGQLSKKGFETMLYCDATSRYAYVEALDAEGAVLGVSRHQETFVPDIRLRPYCDDVACKFVPTTDEEIDRQRVEDEERQRQQEEDRLERERVRVAEEAEQARIKRVWRKIGSALGGTAVSIVVMAFLLTRLSLRRSMGLLRLRLADVIAGTSQGTYRKLVEGEMDGMLLRDDGRR